MPLFIVGNCTDSAKEPKVNNALTRVVAFEEGLGLAKEYGASFMEIKPGSRDQSLSDLYDLVYNILMQ